MTLRENCVAGITANEERLAEQSSAFVGIITAFTPFVGYAEAGRLAERALASGTPVSELIVEAGLMEREDVEVVMAPARLSGEDSSPLALSRDYAAPPGSAQTLE